MDEHQIHRSKKNIAKFIEWVRTDTLKEETRTLQELGLVEADVKKSIESKARQWYLAEGYMASAAGDSGVVGAATGAPDK
jgi:hypothetical protein